jgi:hypothetical protein
LRRLLIMAPPIIPAPMTAILSFMIANSLH